MESTTSSASAIASSATTPCGNCQKPASLSCSGCKDAPEHRGSDKAVHYCSKACQVSHWKSHKQACKNLQAVKRLYRAGDILQEIFYSYRMQLFDKHIAKIENRDGKLLIHYDTFTGKGKYRLGPAEIFVPFPHEMCETVEDKKAVLAHLACSDAVSWMHDLVKHFLKDIASEIVEFTFGLKNNRREAIGVNALGEEDQPKDHDLWGITLRQTGRKYIFDLTGARIYQIVEPPVNDAGWIPFSIPSIIKALTDDTLT